MGDRSIRAGMGSNFFDAGLLPDFMRKFAVQLQYRGFQHGQLSTLRHMPLDGLAESYRAVGAAGTPVLLVWGTEDKVIPFETSRRVLAAMPQAELLAVERAAHTPNYERPELVNAAMVAWLGRLHAPR
jgi:pimeloyl-ACP methyl ester carboxylesterase